MAKKNQFYSLKKIKELHALYNFIFGERSNGKTYAVLEEGVKNYAEGGKQIAIIRRFNEDFTGKRSSVMFDSLINNGEGKNRIRELTHGEWTGVYYFSMRWYLCRKEGDNIVKDDKPIAYGFSLSAQEHDKSTSYPDITTVLFDEVITRNIYLNDEFILFSNVLSTIIRQRTDVIIYMLGNTVNKYCPYFDEMGLKHVRDMKKGTIDLYHYGESGLTVAVEYTENYREGKPSDVYFAFDNPKLSMITGGEWEIDIYPHCPHKFKQKEVVFKYFIIFHEDILQCDIVRTKGMLFTFIHRKTTPIKNEDKDLIYSPEYDPRPNHRRKITNPILPIEKKIYLLYKEEKIFYQDNTIGEIVRNYLLWCRGNG